MKSLFFFLAIVLVLLPCRSSHIYAQEATNLSFQSLTINDGLSQGMVYQVLQDRYGFMWFATKDGLNRYDGYHFTVYQHDPADSNSISDSYVQSILEDSKGRLWAGTNMGIIELFDHHTGSFRHIDTRNNTSKSPVGAVLYLKEDKSGNIWAVYENTCVIITVHTNSSGKINYTWRYLPLSFSSRQPGIFIKNDGTVFLSDRLGEVFVYDTKSASLQPVEGINNFITVLKKDPRWVGLNNFLQDPLTKELFLTCTSGIIAIPDNRAPHMILQLPLAPFNYNFFDSSGNIWFAGTNEKGTLAKFNVLHKSHQLYKPYTAVNWQSLRHVHCMYTDRSGLLWMGTKGYGLLMLDGRSQKFHHMDNSSAFRFFELDDGRITANTGGGLNKVLDVRNGVYTDSIPVEKGKVYFENFNEFYQPSWKNAQGLKWFADERRLACYDPATKQTKCYPLPFAAEGFYVSSFVSLDAKNFWLATNEGLLQFNIINNKWKLYKSDPLNRSTLSFNNVVSLCYDPASPQNKLWVGTYGGGLNLLDIPSEKFTRYGIKEGLPNNVVYGILPDDDNRIWMSTNKGLSCYDPSKKLFSNYEEKDGLQSNEFNSGAYLRTSKGLLFFGGVYGYNYFSPREISGSPVVPKVVLTDVKLKNKSLSFGKEGNELSTTPYLAKSITLPYKGNMISFDFAALDFTVPDRNLYQYKLEHFDKEWIHAGNVHTATYTNLDPGTYIFKVKGSNKDGVWNEAGTSIQLTILPAWYMTWWFRTLIALSLAGMVYLFYRYRLNKALELMAVRNRIASDLHDEIGSNLSNISIFSNVAQQRKTETAEVTHMLGKISENAQISMEAMSDIVWMIKAGNDRFENIMVRMRSLAAEVLEATGYQLHLEFDEKLNNVKLDMNKRKNFYLIFKESVNNIAKYANGNEVLIKMYTKQGCVELFIQDNGKGFNTQSVSGGNGLINMQQRATLLNGSLQINSRENEGTTLHLRFQA